MNNDNYEDSRYDDYERMKKKSTSGRASSKKNRRKISMKYSDYIKSLKIVAGAAAVATGIAISSIGAAYSNIADQLTIMELSGEFYGDVISPETHRTADRENYFYDYGDIAKKIEEYEDFDEAVYLLYANIDEYQTGLVLQHTDYGSFTHYKEVKGYKDTKDFSKDMRHRVLLSEEIKEKEAELRLMQEEHKGENISEEATYGGNNLWKKI